MNDTDISALKAAVDRYASQRGGRIYAPIMHPDFSAVPSHHGHERFEVIKNLVGPEHHSLLDVGSHWGYFPHRFEDMGLQVTAVENNKDYLYFLRSIRELCGKKFEIWDRSVFELPASRYDVVLALAIFHHFIKTEKLHLALEQLLGRLNCDLLIFQAHGPGEGQMEGSFANYAPEEFAEFIARHVGLNRIDLIGKFGSRPMYALTR